MISMEQKAITALELYEYAQRHRLVPGDAVEAVMTFSRLASAGLVHEIAVGGERIALVVVAKQAEGVSSIDIIPESKKLTPDVIDDVAFHVSVLATNLLADGCRRVSSVAPVSRKRTIKILRGAGFQREGTLRLAWQSAARPPEDVVVFGMICSAEKG